MSVGAQARVPVLLGPALENQGGVGAAETERVGEGVLDSGFAGVIGNVVEIALGIRGFLIDGGRKNLVAQGEDANAGFEASGAAEEMAGHRFGGADGDGFG